MKIHVLSDIHLEFSPFDPPTTDADLVVLAGDIGQHTAGIEWAIKTWWGLPPWNDVSGSYAKPLLYVLGNHEAYRAEYHGIRREIQRRAEWARSQGAKIWVLDNDSAEIEGVRFLGTTLWTDYQLYGAAQMAYAMREAERRLTDHQAIRCAPYGAFKPSHALSLHREAVVWLAAELDKPYSGKTVVITHHLPSMLSVPERFRRDNLSAAFASNLDELVKQADLWIHGHTHDNCSYRLGRCRVVCNPRGYVRQRDDGWSAENEGFDPGVVIDTDHLGVRAAEPVIDQAELLRGTDC